MRFFVEEFARGENDDGALILRVYALLLSLLCFCNQSEDHRARKDANASLRREIKTHLSFIISRSQMRAVFGNEGF